MNFQKLVNITKEKWYSGVGRHLNFSIRFPMQKLCEYVYLAIEFHSTVPNIFHPCHCEWAGRTCSCSTQSTAPLPLCCPISASCEYCDLIDATPSRKQHKRDTKHKHVIIWSESFVMMVNCTQTKRETDRNLFNNGQFVSNCGSVARIGDAH